MSNQSIEVEKGRDTVSIRMHLRGYVKKEKPGMYVSYCPALDLCSQGETAKKARENIVEAVQLFIESCLEDGTLHNVLRESGFYLAREKAPKKRQTSAAGFSGGRAVQIPAEIPFLAAHG